MNKAIVSIVLCGALIGLGVLLVASAKTRYDSAAEARRKAMEAEAVEKAPNVRVMILKAHTVEDRLILTGNVAPWEEMQLSAEVGGKIEWQGVDEGDPVTKGEELVRIDTESIRVQLDQAKAQQNLAVQELARVKNLEKEGISSPQNLDQALTDRDVTAATVRSLEVELAKSVVRAPIDGIVDKRMYEQAEFVNRGDPLIRLVQVHKVKVEIGVPERDVPFLAKGDAVRVTVDALEGKEFDGSVYLVATTADAATRTFATEIEVDNADRLLKPGMIARVQLVRHSYPNAISIPMFAVISLENRYLVYVEENGLAQARDVTVGIYQEDWVHILSGLNDGDRLIVAGQRNVRPEEKVNVTEEVTE